MTAPEPLVNNHQVKRANTKTVQKNRFRYRLHAHYCNNLEGLNLVIYNIAAIVVLAALTYVVLTRNFEMFLAVMGALVIASVIAFALSYFFVKGDNARFFSSLADSSLREKFIIK